MNSLIPKICFLESSFLCYFLEENILKSNRFEKCHTHRVLHTIDTAIHSTFSMDKVQLHSKVNDNFCCKGTCLIHFSNLFYHRSSLF